MLPLARLARARGYAVHGSDAKLSGEALLSLRQEGLIAHGPPDPARLAEMEGGIVVYSTAIPENHPERSRANELSDEGKITILHRMDFLNRLVEQCGIRLGLAGTHGKTSSTALAGYMLMDLGLDPLIIAGGRPLYLERSIRNGNSVAVFETDESDGSFLRANATHRLILNVDEDHLSYYGSFEKLKEAFLSFASHGPCIVNEGDATLNHLTSGGELRASSIRSFPGSPDAQGSLAARQSPSPEIYGYRVYETREECLSSNTFIAGYFPNSDDTMEFRVHPQTLSALRLASDSDGGTTGRAEKQGPEVHNPHAFQSSNQKFMVPGPEDVSDFYRFRLRVPGRHFASNALGVLGVILHAFPHVSLSQCVAALESFPGTERRLELLGRYRGIPVYDDYGHHPSEIRAVLQALRQRFPQSSIRVVFQPHRYTRTRELASQFAESLSLADDVFLLPLYSAGEEPIQGVDSSLIANQMKLNGARLLGPGRNGDANGDHDPELDGTNSHLQKDLERVFECSQNSTVLFLGAGDVSALARRFMGSS